jgi:hypothetical protein
MRNLSTTHRQTIADLEVARHEQGRVILFLKVPDSRTSMTDITFGMGAAPHSGLMTEILTVHIPMTFRWRGGHKLIVAPDGTAMTPAPRRPNVDTVLLKALVRAFRHRARRDSDFRALRRSAAGFIPREEWEARNRFAIDKPWRPNRKVVTA